MHHPSFAYHILRKLFFLVVIFDVMIYLGWNTLILFAVIIPIAWLAGFTTVIWLHRHGYRN
jgi:general stress protein CsbA